MSLLPPCNEQVLRDLGGLCLALAVMLCVAVATTERRLVLTALVAYPTASVPHPVFHTRHSEPLSAASGAGPTGLPAAAVVLPALLLWPACAPEPVPAPAD
ncbi:hypothetical protein [Streptomyces sp. HUAS ZL42]|uniref:hypothetical protein n=1 Tax=Streptomyces sp. HUAS ZL42 TaxID=3231715 RepID=UPI00345E79DC